MKYHQKEGLTSPLFWYKIETRKEATQWHIVAEQDVATSNALHRPRSERKTSTSDRKSAGAAFGCNAPHGTKKEGESMDFKEAMNILLKILAMVDKIYHAVVKDAEDADKEDKDESKE